MRSYKGPIAIFGLLVLTIGLYQNCGEGFESAGVESFEQPSQGPLDPQPPPQGMLSFEALSVCMSNVGPLNLVTCLDDSKANAQALDQDTVDLCVQNLGAQSENPFRLAHCIYTSGYWVSDYREFSQSDFEDCLAQVGLASTAQCLIGRGLTKNLEASEAELQAQIDACEANVGLENVEKCVRANQLLPERKVLMQWDVMVSSIVQPNAWTDFLVDRGALAPGQVANVETCLNNVAGDYSSVDNCMRDNNWEVSEVQQVHVNLCNWDAGTENVPGCLNANGLVENPIDALEFQDCVANVGVGSAATCLRAKGLIPDRPEAGDFQLCNELVGQAGIFNCLAGANGYKTYNNFAQANVDTCIANVGLAGAAQCARSNGFIASKLSELMAPEAGVFALNCMGCHSAAAADLNGGGFNMEDFAMLSARVVAGDPMQSPLHTRMTNPNAPMPPVGAGGLRPDNEVAQVAAWIADGAKNN